MVPQKMELRSEEVMHTLIHICIYVYIYEYVYIYIYTYIYMLNDIYREYLYEHMISHLPQVATENGAKSCIYFCICLAVHPIYLSVVTTTCRSSPSHLTSSTRK